MGRIAAGPTIRQHRFGILRTVCPFRKEETKEPTMPNKDPIANPAPKTPRGPTPTPGIPDRTQGKPPLTPVQNPGDTKNSQDPNLNPALVPIGDPASAA